ncbi:TPA: DUF6088 family protein [Pseudomonas aeruginosa]|jgi:hypothetical protein|uniref:Transcriptional regulator, AbiEi antitoxin, Type IV TA system n=1 Tax=Pseudomonas chaetocerotis TaxID=2758695 RepID=A0A931CYC4_9PSED|nr:MULTISPECIES: DUF6088 family protein [Pseudomonadota]ELQ7352962.1 hypothetical protein [Pseudomonas aeruginosa]MBG5841276.1 hypothetical protein [Pseudomonas aeruginosa]MBV5704229.1 hypothetical protein [Pseudomonas aeruginosa]MBV5933787.1 hypothetical protein [Pseudomonas aeruginosa]MBZ9667115.1 DUF6088 family protein [Pseudomonas chaetocerotis]
MSSLAELILTRVGRLPEGSLLSTRDLLHLGSRSAVNQAFSRLAKDGHLLRVARGLYVAPVTTRFGKRSPVPEMVIRSLAVATREVIVANGAWSANALGLTRQMPVRQIFLTGGRSRILYLGKTEIVIKHAPKWQIALGDSFAGQAVRALAWLGPPHSRGAAVKLKKLLPASEWRALQSTRSLLPAWMAELI